MRSSGQPKESDYQQLAALGIKTVIDLQDDPTAYEKKDVEAKKVETQSQPQKEKERKKDELKKENKHNSDEDAPGKAKKVKKAKKTVALGRANQRRTG